MTAKNSEEQIETLNLVSEMVTPELMQQSNRALTALTETQSLLHEELKPLSSRNDDEISNALIALNNFMRQVSSSIASATLITILHTQSGIINKKIITDLQKKCGELQKDNERLKAEIKRAKAGKKNLFWKYIESLFTKLFH